MTVYLVGAGPGDPGLLTIRGRDVLAEADVVLYDDLVNPRLLALAPREALRIGVGKAEKGHGTPQDAINSLLLEYGRSYDCIVRLKGGDPFVFGRGGEEALALAEAGIPFEIVPGVSSAIAAPAFAGIPLTHRGLASSVAIVTGHEASTNCKGGASVNWRRVAMATDTLVILMGVSRLPQIVSDLIAYGRSPQTPAAIVEQGTTSQQRTIVARLRELPAVAASAAIKSPAAIVIGDVVTLRQHLAWFFEWPVTAPDRQVPDTSGTDAGLHLGSGRHSRDREVVTCA